MVILGCLFLLPQGRVATGVLWQAHRDTVVRVCQKLHQTPTTHCRAARLPRGLEAQRHSVIGGDGASGETL